MLGNSASLQQVRRTLEQANTVSHSAAKTDGEVTDASADGSVLLFTPIAPMSVFPHVYEKLGYEPVTDYTPISQVATFDLAVAVGANVPLVSRGTRRVAEEEPKSSDVRQSCSRLSAALLCRPVWTSGKC